MNGFYSKNVAVDFRIYLEYLFDIFLLNIFFIGPCSQIINL